MPCVKPSWYGPRRASCASWRVKTAHVFCVKSPSTWLPGVRPHWRRSTVSRWRAERVCVAIHSDGVVALRLARLPRRALVAWANVGLPDADTVAAAVGHGLASLVSDKAWSKCAFDVVMSDHFVRYALVPWHDNVTRWRE